MISGGVLHALLLPLIFDSLPDANMGSTCLSLVHLAPRWLSDGPENLQVGLKRLQNDTKKVPRWPSEGPGRP